MHETEQLAERILAGMSLTVAASPTRKGGDCPADRFDSDAEVSSEFFVHSKRSYYHGGMDDMHDSRGFHLRDSADFHSQQQQQVPDRFVAGKQFFNYHAFGSLREGLMPISLLSRAHFGLAVTAFFAGLCLMFLRYGYRPLLVAYLSKHHPSQYNAGRYLLDWPGAFSVFIGLLSDCVPLRGTRRKSYILLGWVVSVVVFAGIGITNLFGTSTIVVYDDDTELANSLEKHSDRWVFGVLYVGLSFLGCFSIQVSWVGALAMMIEYAQREPLYQRGHLAATITILFYGAELVIQGVITQLLFPYDTSDNANGSTSGSGADTALESSISLSGAGVILAVAALVPIPFVIYMLDEDTSNSIKSYSQSDTGTAPPLALLHTPSPKGSTPVQQHAPALTTSSLGHGTMELWRFCQQKVVYRILSFDFAFVMVVGIYNQNVRDALARWCDISSANALMVEVVKSGFTLVGLIHAKYFMLNTGWKLVGALGSILFFSIFVTETIPIVFNAVRAKWFYYLLVGILDWPKSWLKMVAVILPTEIATAGNEGATIGAMLSIQVLSIAAAHTLSEILTRIVGTSVTMEEVDADGHETRMHVLTNGMIFYAVNLAGALTVLWLPASKLDAQQMRAFGGYSRSWGTALVLLFLILLLFVLIVNLVKIIGG